MTGLLELAKVSQMDSIVKAGYYLCKVKSLVFEVFNKDQIALAFSLGQHEIEC